MADVADSQGAFRICETTAEVEQINQDGAVALLLAPGFAALGERLDKLFVLRKLGAVIFPMSLNNRNLLADGCGERAASGLSHLGVEAVKRLNDLGIIVDVSHLSDKAFYDVLEVSSGPVLASHSNSRTICDNPRNLSDPQVRALAEKGGCVGTSVHPALLTKGAASINDYVEHVLHFVKLAGENHVTMGADFIDYQIEFMLPKLRPSAELGIYHQGHVRVPELSGFAALSRIPILLKERGLSETAVKKITRDNMLRLLKSHED
jgi:membrane dipeptidase